METPPEAVASPSRFSVNALGQMLVAAPVALPLAEGDLSAERRVWFWNGHMASELTRDVGRTTSTAGSNLVITESAPVPFLSADGVHLYWFSNQARRLQRDGVDLSTEMTWLGSRTDLSGAAASGLSLDRPCPIVRAPPEGARKRALTEIRGFLTKGWASFFF